MSLLLNYAATKHRLIPITIFHNSQNYDFFVQNNITYIYHLLTKFLQHVNKKYFCNNNARLIRYPFSTINDELCNELTNINPPLRRCRSYG